MAIVNKDTSQTFSVKKKYAWRDKFVRLVGSVLVTLVFLGTVLWLLSAANFSWNKFFSNIVENFRPVVRTTEQPKVLSKEEELEKMITSEKILEVDRIERTSENDLLLFSKNGVVVFFDDQKSLDDQVATLQTLLTKARIDNKALKKVDFRFEKIVVEY